MAGNEARGISYRLLENVNVLDGFVEEVQDVLLSVLVNVTDINRELMI